MTSDAEAVVRAAYRAAEGSVLDVQGPTSTASSTGSTSWATSSPSS